HTYHNLIPPSFPTRRSSDLDALPVIPGPRLAVGPPPPRTARPRRADRCPALPRAERPRRLQRRRRDGKPPGSEHGGSFASLARRRLVPRPPPDHRGMVTSYCAARYNALRVRTGCAGPGEFSRVAMPPTP